MSGCGESSEEVIVDDNTLRDEDNRTNERGFPKKKMRSVEEVPLVEVCGVSKKCVDARVVPAKNYPVEVVLQGGSSFSAQTTSSASATDVVNRN